MNTSSGSPASSSRSWQAWEESGQIEACLSTSELPSSRFGAAHRATW